MKILLFIVSLIITTGVDAKPSIIHNVKGYTINQYQLTQFEAIAFEHGRVLEIGTDKKIIAQYPKAELIDGKGNSMLPGLHDASVDLLYAAQLAIRLDLRDTKSKQDVLNKVKAFSEENPYSEDKPKNIWVIGYGWDHKSWENPALPTKEDFDKLNIVNFIWLINKDKDIGWANKDLMRIAKVEKIDKALYGPEIIYNDKNQHTGIFKGKSLKEIQRHVPRLTSTEYYLALVKILNRLNEQGVTSLNIPSTENKTFQRLRKMAKVNKLPIRVNATLTSADPGFERMLEHGSYHEENQFLHIHSVKYFIDGTFDKQEALLKQPYVNNKSNSGKNYQPQHFIQEEMQTLAKENWQVNLQAYGDKANKIALDLITNKNLKTKQMRHSIENAALVDSRDINKFNKSNAIVSIHPNKSIQDMPFLNTLIGKNRTNSSHPWKALTNYGIKLISGSNFPNSSPNPFFGIHAAVTRQTRKEGATVWNKPQQLSVEQALASYTINAAFANRQEDSLGSLEKGKWADFILVDQDIFQVNPNDIWKTQVLETWISGKNTFNLTNEKK